MFDEAHKQSFPVMYKELNELSSLQEFSAKMQL
jgi:hypothetical protein